MCDNGHKQIPDVFTSLQGEMFRKTFLLQNLISEFSPTVGYVTYVNSLVISIKSMLPSNKAAVVMVKQEVNLFLYTGRLFWVQHIISVNKDNAYYYEIEHSSDLCDFQAMSGI